MFHKYPWLHDAEAYYAIYGSLIWSVPHYKKRYHLDWLTEHFKWRKNNDKC
jgi:hypothetical protein